jgi:hypothetical protein
VDDSYIRHCPKLVSKYCMRLMWFMSDVILHEV